MLVGNLGTLTKYGSLCSLLPLSFFSLFYS